MLFLLQNFMNIDGTTLILIFWFSRVSAGLQKPQTLTASKTTLGFLSYYTYHTFKYIASLLLIGPLTCASGQKIPLNFSKLLSSYVLLYDLASEALH